MSPRVLRSTGETLHRCIAPECKVQVPLAVLCCQPHWFALPANLRSQIVRAWQHRQNPRLHVEARRQAAVTHLAFVRTAAEHLNAQFAKKQHARDQQRELGL